MRRMINKRHQMMCFVCSRERMKNVYAKTGCQESETGEITVMELTCPA